MRAQRSAASGFTHSVTSHTPDIGKQLCQVTEELNLKRRLQTMKCGTITGARLHQEAMSRSPRRFWAVFVTLTYAGIDDWSPKHISQYLTACRNYLRRRGVQFRYVWTCELQKRGAPHYHVIVWLPYGQKIPKPDASGWWPHGRSNIKKAEKPVGYIAKYASKGGTYEHEMPRGIRIHGTGGLDRRGAAERRWWLFPKWVRKHFPNIEDLGRAVGGGVVNRDTGEIAASPYRVVKIGGKIWITERILENGREQDQN